MHMCNQSKALHELQKGFHVSDPKPKVRRSPARNTAPETHIQLEGSAAPHDAGKGKTPGMGSWQTITIDDAFSLTNTIYSNIFDIFTKCNADREFIKDITLRLRGYIQESHLQLIALKAIATLPQVICQRTQSKSKTTEDVKVMQRRMEIWKSFDVTELLKETHVLQRKIRKLSAQEPLKDKARYSPARSNREKHQ